MNIRKIISFGKNSYVISIPKQWIDKNKLKKGDIVSIEEGKDGLLLRTNQAESKKQEPKSIIINAENKNLSQLRTEIISAYLNNYDIIEVISKDLKTNAPAIRDMLHDLSGMEIIDQSSARIVAKDLININEVSIKTLIRRMDNITRSMIEDAIECFDGINHADSLAHIDEEVNRLHFLTYRIIRGGLRDVRIANSIGANFLKLHSDHTVTSKIEAIADSLKRMSRSLNHSKLNEKWRDELKGIFNRIKQSYLDVMKAYYINDEKIALEIEQTNKERIKACDNFFNKHNHKDLKFDNKTIREGICDFRIACDATTRILENMKEMTSSIKYIARTVIGGG